MNNIETITRNEFTGVKLFSGSPARVNYLWKNLIIEKNISLSWVDKLYKESILHAFWFVLSSPVG
jgi:hypothetical protein